MDEAELVLSRHQEVHWKHDQGKDPTATLMRDHHLPESFIVEHRCTFADVFIIGNMANLRNRIVGNQG